MTSSSEATLAVQMIHWREDLKNLTREREEMLRIGYVADRSRRRRDRGEDTTRTDRARQQLTLIFVINCKTSGD